MQNLWTLRDPYRFRAHLLCRFERMFLLDNMLCGHKDLEKISQSLLRGYLKCYIELELQVLNKTQQ